MRRTAQEGLLDRLLQNYHYLGYTRPVGEHLKYLVYGQGQPVLDSRPNARTSLTASGSYSHR
ncbi:MAG: hypothetical protein NT154_21420 [Verrucomicrobia bacterium]|nr:hypothetical protein [Verrucomicrobiota bacterium]